MDASAQPAIETVHLRKTFGDKIAISDLTLTVERGEVFGFLGPNGAGKTTAVKMLLGLIAPSAGRGQLLGAPLGDHRVRARVGFLPEHFRFHEWLTAREFLTSTPNCTTCRTPSRASACPNCSNWSACRITRTKN